MSPPAYNQQHTFNTSWAIFSSRGGSGCPVLSNSRFNIKDCVWHLSVNSTVVQQLLPLAVEGIQSPSYLAALVKNYYIMFMHFNMFKEVQPRSSIKRRVSYICAVQTYEYLTTCRFCVVQPTMCSTLSVCDIHPRKFPTTFTLFPACFEYPCTIEVSLPSLYLWCFSHDKKYQALHTCTTSVFAFRSMGPWERGYNIPCVIHDHCNGQLQLYTTVKLLHTRLVLQ